MQITVGTGDGDAALPRQMMLGHFQIEADARKRNGSVRSPLFQLDNLTVVRRPRDINDGFGQTQNERLNLLLDIAFRAQEPFDWLGREQANAHLQLSVPDNLARHTSSSSPRNPPIEKPVY